MRAKEDPCRDFHVPTHIYILYNIIIIGTGPETSVYS